MQRAQKSIMLLACLILTCPSITGRAASTRNQSIPSSAGEFEVSRTRLAALTDKSIEIDFNDCTPRKQRIDVDFGSTTYEIVGPSQDGVSCVFRWGGEVENPNWDGWLTRECLIPRRLGKQRFPVTQAGVNFSSIEKHCRERKKEPS
jgi:hypothetical protein